MQAFSPLIRLKKDDVFKWEPKHQKAFEEIKSYLTNPPILSPFLKDKSMKLYIAASECTIGSMLTQEVENGVERAIYYLSRVLNDVETRYHPSEKLCLCLYFSCTKLKHYIKPFDVYAYSHFDIIKHMVSKPILHSRVGKGVLALTEYSLTYKSLKVVKGQIVADFIADHSIVEVMSSFADFRPWKLYFDGPAIESLISCFNIIFDFVLFPFRSILLYFTSIAYLYFRNEYLIDSVLEQKKED